MHRVQRLQLLCPWANSRDNGGFQFPSKNCKYFVCWAWLYVLGCSRTRGQQLFWHVMFLERAVGEFPAYGKSKHFAFPARYCCCWANRFCFFQCILLIIEREVFQRIQKVERLFLIQIFILGEGSVPKNGLCRLVPLHCVAATWKNCLNIKKEDWYERGEISLKCYLFLLYVNSEKNKKQGFFFVSVEYYVESPSAQKLWLLGLLWTWT